MAWRARRRVAGALERVNKYSVRRRVRQAWFHNGDRLHVTITGWDPQHCGRIGGKAQEVKEDRGRSNHNTRSNAWSRDYAALLKRQKSSLLRLFSPWTRRLSLPCSLFYLLAGLNCFLKRLIACYALVALLGLAWQNLQQNLYNTLEGQPSLDQCLKKQNGQYRCLSSYKGQKESAKSRPEWVVFLIDLSMAEHHQRLPRPGSLGSTGRIPGGKRIPSAAGDRCAIFIRVAISTRALASPRAGTIQLLQLHGIPCHANLPIFPPQVGLGQIRRPDNGASPPYSLPVEVGKRLGFIHLRGCRKT